MSGPHCDAEFVVSWLALQAQQSTDGDRFALWADSARHEGGAAREGLVRVETLSVRNGHCGHQGVSHEIEQLRRDGTPRGEDLLGLGVLRGDGLPAVHVGRLVRGQRHTETGHRNRKRDFVLEIALIDREAEGRQRCLAERFQTFDRDLHSPFVPRGNSLGRRLHTNIECIRVRHDELDIPQVRVALVVDGDGDSSLVSTVVAGYRDLQLIVVDELRLRVQSFHDRSSLQRCSEFLCGRSGET